MGTVLDKTSMAHGVVRPAAAAAMVSIALLLGACAQSGDLGLGLGLDGDKPKTSDIATASAGARPEADLEKATAYWGEQHGKNPRDPKAAIAYARNLKALGRKTQALAVMQASYMYSPDDKEFLSEYGRLSLDMGQISTAGELLARADDPGKPDWKILSARGTVLAKQGRLKEAIELYEKARSLAPEQASLMNNLAMAYTMDGQAARGEALLRQAANSGSTDPRVKQNLALVLDLQGKPANAPAGAAVEAIPVASAAGPGPASAQPAVMATAKPANWNKPLPMETASGPVKVKPAAAPAAAPVDPDQVVRQALAAEQAKASGR